MEQDNQSEQQIQIPQTAKKPVIRKSTEYLIEGKGKLTELTALQPSDNPDLDVVYQGFTIVVVGTPDGPQQIPVEFYIPGAKTLDEAVDKFTDAMNIQLQQMAAEARAAYEEANRPKLAIPTPGGGMRLVTD